MSWSCTCDISRRSFCDNEAEVEYWRINISWCGGRDNDMSPASGPAIVKTKSFPSNSPSLMGTLFLGRQHGLVVGA